MLCMQCKFYVCTICKIFLQKKIKYTCTKNPLMLWSAGRTCPDPPPSLCHVSHFAYPPPHPLRNVTYFMEIMDDPYQTVIGIVRPRSIIDRKAINKVLSPCFEAPPRLQWEVYRVAHRSSTKQKAITGQLIEILLPKLYNIHADE